MRRAIDRDEVPYSDMMKDLHRLSQGRDKYDDLIIDAVTVARTNGYSWGMIGEALGVTRQAAFARYNRWCEPLRTV